MHRFFLTETPLVPNQVVDLAPIAHQVRKVLRMKPGEQIVLLDNRGAAYPTEIRALVKGSAIGYVLSCVPVESEPPVCLTLFLCVLKGGNFDWVLQKGTELGVSHFVPVISSRTVVRPMDKVTKKMDRYRAILREAAEQSGRGRLPTLGDPLGWDEAIHQATESLRLLPWEGGQDRPGLGAFLSSQPQPPTALSLLIGPEGGFDPEEITQAEAAGWQVVSLGPRILRAETAAQAAVTVALDRLGGMG
jgi:16S rRNA (uracil1498-N3)-methyltransferase